MNKRISTLSLFVVGTLLLGLMGAIAALAAPSAATADGTVSLDAEWYSTSGSLKITVKDADLDVLVATSSVLALNLADGASVGETLETGAGNSLVGTPVIITDTDCTADPLAADTNLNVLVFNADDGTITISAFAATGGTVRPTICFDVSGKDTATVTLTSTQDATTFVASPLTVTQVDASSDEYTVTVTLNTTASTTTNPFALKVLNGDTITVKYTDADNAAGAENVPRTDTARVETNPTLISAVGPLHNTATQVQLPQFTATLNDSDSGIDIGKIYVLIDRDDSGLITYDLAGRRIKIVGTDPTALLPFFTAGVLDSTKLQTEVDDVANTEILKPSVTGDGAPTTNVTITFTPTTVLGAANTESDINWFIAVFDKAGNATLSDSDPASIDDLGVDAVAGGGDDGLQLLDVDEPTILRVDRKLPEYFAGDVLTGNYWDADTSTVKSNRKNSIEVQFSEKLDGTSVSAGDFTVDLDPTDAIDGLTPSNAEVFSKLETSVFLTLAADLAPDAKPAVALTAGVADKAGNTQTSINAIEATDKIAPAFTVTVDKTLTNKGISIAITSDEAVSGNLPTIQLYKKDEAVIVEKIMPVVVTGTNTWKSEVTTALNVAQGDISIYVEGKDLAQNLGTQGQKDSTALGSLVFVYDTVINNPTFDPVKSLTTTLTSVETIAPFIRVIFDEKVSITKGEFGVKGSTTLADVTSAMFSSDNKTWIYSASGLTVDEDYELNIDAKDLAGNEKKAQNTDFTVKARAKIKVAVVPGNNLISLPGAPANADINLVGIPSEVTSVITYDPTPAGIAAGGPWLVATRDAAGNLVGNLTTMDSLHAYWVETTSTAPIEVDIPQQGFAAVPPSIVVVNGWNLVPVVSVAGDIPGTTINADLYFGSTAWITAYTFNTTTNTWIKVLPNQIPADTVTVGNGYWLYVGADGVLVP